MDRQQTRKDDPAFPIYDSDGEILCQAMAGLTKREYFAAMALQGLLSSNVPLTTTDSLAFDAIHAADALIKHLNDSELPQKY